MTGMNIVLINLTRFGDLLQSQAAIADLAARGHRVAVVCLENFAGAASLLHGVMHISALPSAGLLAALDKGSNVFKEGSAMGGMEGFSPCADWAKALGALAAWKKSLLEVFPVDAVCNLTPTLSARLLARFVAGDAPCTGFAVDAHGFGYSGNGWTAFLQGASAFRGVSPYNVVDLFRMVARIPQQEAGKPVMSPACAGGGELSLYEGITLPGDGALRGPDADTMERMRHTLEALAPEGCAGFVALQLGASNDIRRWPVSSFAALGERLWREERLCPVLLGSTQEQALAERYEHLCGQKGGEGNEDSPAVGASITPCINLCGKTSLEELAAVLCGARLLVTNDTGTMHLAAGLRVPVLAIFLATAQPFDTGPYLAGSCSVEPDISCHPCAFGASCSNDHSCRRAVPPQFMTSLALSFLRKGTWRMPHPEDGRGRVWVAEPDAFGFMNLRSLSGHDAEDRGQWLQLLRHGIRQFVDRKRGLPFHPVPADRAFTFSSEEQRALAAGLERAEGIVHALVQRGKALLAHPVAPLKEKFLRSWEEAHTEFSRSPRLGALAVLWLEETQAEGQELPEILTVMEGFSSLLGDLRLKIVN